MQKNEKLVEVHAVGSKLMVTNGNIVGIVEKAIIGAGLSIQYQLICYPHGERTQGVFNDFEISPVEGGATIDETRSHSIDNLHSITSVISNIQFFVAEKWKIAGDKGGSGNTANIGSIQRIEDIIHGNGMFSRLGEEWFDDYWMNFGKITTIINSHKQTSKITSLDEFVAYRKGDTSLIVSRNNAQ